jgi:hypothetical protein
LSSTNEIREDVLMEIMKASEELANVTSPPLGVRIEVPHHLSRILILSCYSELAKLKPELFRILR